MARDHRKLSVFHDAHGQVLSIYKHTRNFPRDEWYALRLQMRKAAVPIPSNIVEGNARRTTREYVHFLNVARGSAAEVTYLVDLASELGYLSGAVFKVLFHHGLPDTTDQRSVRPRDRRPKTTGHRHRPKT